MGVEITAMQTDDTESGKSEEEGIGTEVEKQVDKVIVSGRTAVPGQSCFTHHAHKQGLLPAIQTHLILVADEAAKSPSG